MRYSCLLALVALVALAACDDDDPSDLVSACTLEVAFLVDGDGRCMSGVATTQDAGTTLTFINLTGVDAELLTFTIAGLEEGANVIPPTDARYTTPDGVLYESVEGGTLTVDELDGELDGSFEFTAASGADRIVVSRGVIEALQFN